MADVEANLDAATQATAAAVAATAGEIARVEAVAESAIESAEARVEAAEALAQQITDAALQTEIGNQVSLLREDCIKWRVDHESLQTQVTLLETSLRDQTIQIAELVSRLANPLPSIPLTPSEVTPALAVETGTETALVSPLQADADGNTESEIPLQVRRKKRFV